MVPKRLIIIIHFSGNGNHTFFVFGDIGLCVNKGTGYLAEKVHAHTGWSDAPLFSQSVSTIRDTVNYNPRHRELQSATFSVIYSAIPP
jgi:hypothetical protein